MITNYQNKPRAEKLNLLLISMRKFPSRRITSFSSRRLTSAVMIFGLVLGSSAALAPVAQASSTCVSESATYDTAATIEFAVPVFNDGDF